MERSSGVRAIVRFVSVVALTLLTAATSQARIYGTATPIRDPANGIPFGPPDAALGTPWRSYKLSLFATSNETIQKVEATISGQLHQRWTSSNFDGNYDTKTGNSTNMANGDSHFLATGTMLFANGPNEDNPATGSPLSPSNTESTGWGVGSSMSATFGPVGAPLANMDVAYIVMPSNSTPKIRIKAFDPQGKILASYGVCEFSFAPCRLVVDDLGPISGDASLNPPNVPTIVSGIPSWFSREPVTWALDGSPTGPGVPFHAPSIDPGTGQFSWNINGSKAGLYTFNIRATESLNGPVVPQSAVGKVTVLVAVPEPAPIQLLFFAVALVGLVCVARPKRTGIH